LVASKIPKPELIACQKKYLEASLSIEKCAAGNDERYYTQWCPKRELVCKKWEHKCLVHDRWSGKYDYWDRSEYGCLHFGWTDDFCSDASGDRCFDDS
jgi:hypothetical protein